MVVFSIYMIRNSSCFMFLALIQLRMQVVKNVASQSLEVKKLVYLYLLHYA